MSSFLESFYANGALLVMWGALIFHLLLPIPQSAHPVHFWQRLAIAVADKVNQPTNTARQQTLSGLLAWTLFIIPTVVVLLAMQSLAWQEQFYQLALLLLALDWRGNETLTQQLIRGLSNEDKDYVRTTLKTSVNRETAPLSLIGLGKASAETLILGYSRRVIGVLFWYGLLGGIGALIYRLAMELARSWSPAQPQFQSFGKPAALLFAVLDAIPQKLFALLIMIGASRQSMTSAIEQSRTWHNSITNWLLCGYANKFGLSFGGPAMYDATKYQRARIGGKVVPSAYHIALLQKDIAWRIYAWLMLQSAIIFIINKGF
ncbi:cobalamin biosynthesis family protein [Vibrio methylphosphonaticus]|uniref:cobalamin biosynthesis family protein n=1 Tax=Vibrio methylphosphonaticus TaxID=2946866 RepID=UPI00202A3881|nr:cobalamin biosynthesis family protein [Vibrio methylphosphonaticus]MCL9773373.1 cobalamin biosynthesis family protein [Vibrio methylphosphonaticus]